MSELLIFINQDIKKCEDILKNNDYLEMVICLEELVDKYKEYIVNLDVLDQSRVWNYSKKDLENIKEKLEYYRDKIVDDYNKSILEESSLNNSIKNLKSEINNNTNLSTVKIEEVMDKIEEVENINKRNLSLEEKWNTLKHIIAWVGNQDACIGINFINIINKMFEN